MCFSISIIDNLYYYLLYIYNYVTQKAIGIFFQTLFLVHLNSSFLQKFYLFIHIGKFHSYVYALSIITHNYIIHYSSILPPPPINRNNYDVIDIFIVITIFFFLITVIYYCFPKFNILYGSSSLPSSLFLVTFLMNVSYKYSLLLYFQCIS